jgi:hypothetical protein|tara:strand:+ start:318 stop:731 length:414 start_codon:yes stop_codon:yes gene_type:complete
METKNNFQIKLSRNNKLKENTLYVTPTIPLIDTPYSVTLTKSTEKFSFDSKFQDSNEHLITVELNNIKVKIGKKSGRIYSLKTNNLSISKLIKELKVHLSENFNSQKTPRFLNNIKFSLKLIKVLSDSIDKRLPNTV